MAHYLLQRLHAHFQLLNSLEKLLFHGYQRVDKEEVAQSFHLCRVYSLSLAKTKKLSLSFSLLSSSGSLQSSCNTPFITLSEFGLEVIFA